MRFHQGITSFTKPNYVDTCTLGNAQLIFYSQSLKMLVNAYQHLFWPYTLNRSFHDLSLRAPLSGQEANGRPKLLVLRDKNRGGRHFSILWWEGSMFLYVMWLSQLAFRHQIKRRSCLTNQLFDHQMSKNRKCNAFLRYLNTNPIFVNQTIVIMQWQKEFTFNSTRSSSTEIEKWSIIIFTSEAFLFFLARLFSRKEVSYS